MKLIGKRKFWIALALCAILSPAIPAQDHQHDTDSLEGAHARMKELMGKVESRLKSIDELLDDASARDKQASPSQASAIDQVLVVSRDRAKQNLDDIDEILRLSLHPHPGSSGGGA